MLHRDAFLRHNVRGLDVFREEISLCILAEIFRT